MGVLDWVKNQTSFITDEVKRHQNKKFLEAVMAGCAMTAFADGEIKAEEKAKMSGFIQRNETLKVFEMKDAIEIFEKHVKALEFDTIIGQAEALKSIGQTRGNTEESKLLIRVCLAVAAADAAPNEKEKDVIRIICKELGLEPALFDL